MKDNDKLTTMIAWFIGIPLFLAWMYGMFLLDVWFLDFKLWFMGR